MKSPRQEWYDDEADPAPYTHRLHMELLAVDIASARRAGKVAGIRFMQTITDEVSKPLKELGKSFSTLGKAMNLVPPVNKFDPRVPTHRAHSMTPPKNTVWDHRGRKRY